jgi:hypothetical protein
MRKIILHHLLVAFAGLLCLLTACEKPEPPELPKDVLTAIAPQDGAALSYKDFGFHWTASKAGGFRFRILNQGVTVIDTLTNEDHYFPHIRLNSPTPYIWELSQGDLKITRSFSVASFFAPYVGTYGGSTRFRSVMGIIETYADSLTWDEANNFAYVSLQIDGGSLGDGPVYAAGGIITANWVSMAYNAHLEFDTSDSSIAFFLYRQRNSRGDYETYTFSSN